MSFNRMLGLFVKWGLPAIVAAATFLCFIVAVIQTPVLSSASPSAIWASIVSVLTSAPGAAAQAAKAMHLTWNVSLAWAAIRVYMASAGLKWDFIAARHIVRGHVLIVAGGLANKDAKPRHDQESETSTHRSNAACTVDIGLSLAAQKKTVVLCRPELASSPKHWKLDSEISVMDMNVS